ERPSAPCARSVIRPRARSKRSAAPQFRQRLHLIIACPSPPLYRFILNVALHLTFASEYDVLRPPAAFFASTFFRMRSSISRRAVSCEHLVSFAHFEEV